MPDTQGIKDTFYTALRGRIAAGNASRTIIVRGVIRPGVLVMENELPGQNTQGLANVEAFCLVWKGLTVDNGSALPLVTMRCEIHYATDGSAAAAGMDRGRLLAAMDMELTAAVTTMPMNTVSGTTRVFWGQPVFAEVVTEGERLLRMAEVEVYGHGQ